MVKRTSTGRVRGTADATDAIDELTRLAKAAANIVRPLYGDEMALSDREARELAEPAGRILSRYTGAIERVQEFSDPVLLLGAIATVVFPRALVVLGRRAAAAYAPPPAPVRETTQTVSRTETVREPEVPYANGRASEHVERTISRMQSAV